MRAHRYAKIGILPPLLYSVTTITGTRTNRAQHFGTQPLVDRICPSRGKTGLVRADINKKLSPNSGRFL